MTSPRVLVSLPPAEHDLLRRVAKATDQSMAAVLRDLFQASTPVLLRVAEACERAKTAKAESRAGIAAALRVAEAAVIPLQLSALGELDKAMESLPGLPQGSVGGGRSGARRYASPPPPDPRPVITGVKPGGSSHPSKKKQGVSERQFHSVKKGG